MQQLNLYFVLPKNGWHGRGDHASSFCLDLEGSDTGHGQVSDPKQDGDISEPLHPSHTRSSSKMWGPSTRV